MDIVEILQKYIDNLTKEKYKNDPCLPEFIVSILYEDKDIQKLILTIKHMGQKFSHVLFPIKENQFGYDEIETQIEELYNRTMFKLQEG